MLRRASSAAVALAAASSLPTAQQDSSKLSLLPQSEGRDPRQHSPAAIASNHFAKTGEFRGPKPEGEAFTQVTAAATATAALHPADRTATAAAAAATNSAVPVWALNAIPPPLPPVEQYPFPPSPPPNSTAPYVPKKIWMFWDNDQPPEFIAACIEQIVRLNPGWTLHLLRPNELMSMTGLVEPLPVDYLDVAHAADWFRISALAMHGGVWMDASIAVLKPVESWVDLHSDAQVQGFAMPGNTDDVTMENWAFAAPYPSRFAQRWRDNFKIALQMGTDNYCDNLPDSVLGSLGRTMLPYLTQHAAWRDTRHQLPWVPVRVVNSDSDRGPFYLLQHVYRMDAQAMMSTGPDGAFNIPESEWRDKYENVSFVKLRGAERQYLRPLSEYHGYLAITLKTALDKGYVGGDYIEMNPYSIWWWINVAIASLSGGVLIGACLATLITVWLVRKCACCLDYVKKAPLATGDALVKS